MWTEEGSAHLVAKTLLGKIDPCFVLSCLLSPDHPLTLLLLLFLLLLFLRGTFTTGTAASSSFDCGNLLKPLLTNLLVDLIRKLLQIIRIVCYSRFRNIVSDG